MIYLDASVALSALFGERRRPPDALWRETLASSRLLEIEMMVRVNAAGLSGTAGEAARSLIDGVAMVDLHRPVLARALEVFPVRVRTLDAIHLATMDFLRGQGLDFEVATYDRRLAEVAEAMGFKLADV